MLQIIRKVIVWCFLLFSVKQYADEIVPLNIFIGDFTTLRVTTDAETVYFVAGWRNESLRSNALDITAIGNALFINHQQYASSLTLMSELPLRVGDIDYAGALKLDLFGGNQIRVLNQVYLEDYVSGVIAAEIGGGTPVEALKAQAVATRTITIAKVLGRKHIADGYDLCNTVHCQVYKGLTGQTPASYRAAIETTNLILLFNDRPIEAFYSSHCGGMPESAGNLWSVSHPYLTNEPDTFCMNRDLVPNWNSRFIEWSKSFSMREIGEAFSVNNFSQLSISKKNTSGRVEELTIQAFGRNSTITGQYEIRNRLSLASTLFNVRVTGQNVVITGSGYGHGVGMCQAGAIARANAGQSFQDILSHYFPKTVLDADWLINNTIRDFRN